MNEDDGYDGPAMVDAVNPTDDEIRAWAYSDSYAPMEDWDVIIAFPAHMDVLLECVGDEACPGRRLLLRSLYCLVGHTDLGDPALGRAVQTAAESGNVWLETWARRARRVIDSPGDMDRDEWCFDRSGANTPDG